MERLKASDFDQRAPDLYDDYAHGRLSRRDFAQRIAAIAVGGVTAETIIASLTPNYAWAQQVAPNDSRIRTESFEYDSPKGGKKIRGLLARPAKDEGKFPAVLVIHENPGLNPYIEDVARRLATEGFLALAPDALSPLVPLKQQAGERWIVVGRSLTRRVVKLPPKSSRSKNSQPIRERMRHSRYFCGAKRRLCFALSCRAIAIIEFVLAMSFCRFGWFHDLTGCD